MKLNTASLVNLIARLNSYLTLSIHLNIVKSLTMSNQNNSANNPINQIAQVAHFHGLLTAGLVCLVWFGLVWLSTEAF